MWRLIPMLLLAAVTLSTGDLLPRLSPLKLGPNSAADQTSRETLRRLLNSESNSIYDTDNKQYNDYVTNRQRANLQDNNFGRVRYYYQPRSKDRNYFQGQNPNTNEERLLCEMCLPPIKTMCLRNKDIIQDDIANMCDKYISTMRPFDFIRKHRNCLFKAMSRPSSPSKALADADILKWLAGNEKLNTNEIVPSIETMDKTKRLDTEETGEKEIPDLLISDGETGNGETGDVQKKLFSFWSRLQALSPKGRQLPTRRHTFTFYGSEGTRDGPLTAETRASHLRPPGQPLRWG